MYVYLEHIHKFGRMGADAAHHGQQQVSTSLSDSFTKGNFHITSFDAITHL